MVGAVVVSRGRVVGEGFHRRAGEEHAEVAALRKAGPRARGADLYVTLEPCDHFGRTPPCTAAIRGAGIARVIAALADPNPLSGSGARALRRGGIAVRFAGGSLARRAERQNERFLVALSRGRPFVLAKWAATLDGRIADRSRASRWITGEPARRRALLLREEHDAVLVGARTVAADDPLLTRRLGKNPARHWRIVLSGRLRLPEDARLFRSPEGLVVATALPERHPRVRRLSRRGVEIWSLLSRSGRVAPRDLLRRMRRAGISSVLVEGGGATLASFFEAGVVDRVCVFLAPRIFGAGPSAVEGAGFPLARAPRLSGVEVERLGDDVMVTGALAGASRRSR
jgi:diaminohydroxyphosphoribosylaminopyrimidine deaminase / 5-amino-6-(5-phosphoribosylamino)uracil reductase